MLASAAGGRPSSSGVTVRGRSEFQRLVSVLSFTAAFRNKAGGSFGSRHGQFRSHAAVACPHATPTSRLAPGEIQQERGGMWWNAPDPGREFGPHKLTSSNLRKTIGVTVSKPAASLRFLNRHLTS